MMNIKMATNLLHEDYKTSKISMVLLEAARGLETVPQRVPKEVKDGTMTMDIKTSSIVLVLKNLKTILHEDYKTIKEGVGPLTDGLNMTRKIIILEPALLRGRDPGQDIEDLLREDYKTTLLLLLLREDYKASQTVLGMTGQTDHRP